MQNSFLFKETNYTKFGKMVNGKSWNSYPQMLKSISHSLRLQQESENLHIITSKTKDNEIISLTSKEHLLDYIQSKINDNIKKYENTNLETEQRKKLFKDYSNARVALSKKVPLDLLEIELKKSNDVEQIIKNLISTHKLELKQKDKRTLKTLKNFILLKEGYEKEKQSKKYHNQVLLKEVLLKIPENQKLNLSNEQWKIIIENFTKTYFKEYELYFYCLHNDEGSQEPPKGHVHLFLSGYNNINGDFDIQKNIFKTISEKNNLELDFNNKEHHQQIMQLFQKDFYKFFNQNLLKMGIKEEIKLKEYQSIEELNKRLKIKQEDHLTINEKHEKLANKVITEKLEHYQDMKDYSHITCELSENLLTNSLTLKTNLIQKDTNTRVNFFTKMIKIGQSVGKYVSSLENKIKELNKHVIGQNGEISHYLFKLKFQEEENLREWKIKEERLRKQFLKESDAMVEELEKKHKKELEKSEKIIQEKVQEVKNLEYKNPNC